MATKKRISTTQDLFKDIHTPSNDVIMELLKPHKTIRDAVHGDIMVNRLEVSIMDTKEFQRLRKIKQLGTTHFVYPSANHTRFEHSLGALHMAQHIMKLVLRNPHKDPRVTINVYIPEISMRYPSESSASDAVVANYHILLLRTCALLHDLAHIPFGHTLEDEGFLFDPEWKDEKRVKHFIGDTSTIGGIIKDELTQRGLDGQQFLKDVREILKSSKDDLSSLPFPFISDIIDNTICADLLDYVRRDMFHCGLRETYDERFLTYFYLGIYRDKPRLLLRLIKPKTRQLRRDVLSETLHLLRLRYSLGEKVYTHHAKTSSSAMIISAVQSAMENKVLKEEDLYELGDEELMTKLKLDPIGAHLVQHLEKRRLYKPVYKLKYTESKVGNSISGRKEELIESLKNKKVRYQHDRALETMSDLDPGQIIAYCPGREMGQKVVATLVDHGGAEPCPLNKVADNDLSREIKSSIVDKHLNLWNMYVFVDRSIPKDIQIDIASDCSKHFGLDNEIEDRESCQDRRDYRDRFRLRAEKELGSDIASSIHDEICAEAATAQGADRFKVIPYSKYLSAVKERTKV